MSKNNKNNKKEQPKGNASSVNSGGGKNQSPQPKFTPLGYKNNKGEDNWRNYDPGKRFGEKDLKTLKKDGFTGNQQLKIAASVNPKSITGGANAKLFNINKAPARTDYVRSAYSGFGPASGGGAFDAGLYSGAQAKFLKDNNYKGKNPGKLLKWQGIGQGLQVQKENYTRGYSGTNQDAQGAPEGTFGEWTPRTGWNNPFRSGDNKRIGGGQKKATGVSSIQGAKGDGFNYGKGNKDKGGGKDTGIGEIGMPEKDLGPEQTSPNYYGPGGPSSYVDGNATGFRRRKSSARLAGLTSKGTSQFKITGQTGKSSGLNIGYV